MFGMLFGVVIQVKDKTKMFKHILGYLNSTLDSLKPLIEEITEYNKVLHLPKEELKNFTIQMEMRVELIHKCSKETGQQPSLLVLDEVWPGSEPILDKFDNFKTSYYKILVTLRSEFRTFGSPYYLQSINDEGTMTLSHHSCANSFESLDDEDLEIQALLFLKIFVVNTIMTLELVGGAALGTAFAALYDVVKIALGRTVMQFKPLLGDLKFTLDSLKPRIIQQIGEPNLALGLPNKEIDSLQQQMEEGVKLVVKLSKLSMWSCSIWCNCCNCIKPSYTDQLVELDRSLRILLEILKQQEIRDVNEALLLARKIHDKQDELDKKLSGLLKVQQESALRVHEEWNGREFSRSNNSQTTWQK
ncbi:PREDICTED: probable [Prunus dulcis]|uniref:PREDICTED: probable n=1 Tax=Prunus dulcis TaxID=3755 RepID=A0A5E4FHE7_PRUDU|nr:PREDICTED: probable [Prunus dulcis]